MPPVVKDRRRHPRYKIENSVSIMPDGVYQVTDISRGGFCFKCPPYTAIRDNWVTDILNPIEPLEGYPVSRVWVSTPVNNSRGYMPIVVGAKFKSLSNDQNALLSRIMQSLPQNSEPEDN